MSETSHAHATFMSALSTALHDAPDVMREETLADFAAHFDEGRAQGRSDEDIAAALGDPHALAAELRIDRRIAAWERKRTVPAAARLLASLVGLGAVNTAIAVILAPLAAIAAFMAAILVAAFLIAGLWLLFAGASLGLPGGAAATLLAGVGMLAGAASLGALTGLAALLLADLTSKYARLRLAVLPKSLRAGARA